MHYNHYNDNRKVESEGFQLQISDLLANSIRIFADFSFNGVVAKIYLGIFAGAVLSARKRVQPFSCTTPLYTNINKNVNNYIVSHNLFIFVCYYIYKFFMEIKL